MDLIADHGRRVTVEELNTTQLLAHARKQAHKRGFDDILIVDVDAHHYENEHYDEFLPFMENDVLRQLVTVGRSTRQRPGVVPIPTGYQDMGGRVTRYPMRSTEKTDDGQIRDVQLGHRWMDAMGVDYSCLFPTGMLNIGLHPQTEMEVDLCWAYNRWLTEKVIPEAGGRFSRCFACRSPIRTRPCARSRTFGGRKHVGGFMITTVRSNMGVHDNAYMKVYRAMEERGLAIAFHSGVNWSDTAFKSCNRFISVHALGFTFYNIVNCTNWVINGIGRALPQAARDLDGIGISLGAVPDAAARPRIHAAAVGSAAAQEKAVGIHARDVLFVAADGNSGLRRDEGDVPHDQRGDAAPLFIRLSALGFRFAVNHLGFAVPIRESQAQYPRRHRRAAVQTRAAQ